MSADIDVEEEAGRVAYDLERGISDDKLEHHLRVGDGRHSTHWDGCFVAAGHDLCALAEILRLRGYIRKLDAIPRPVTDDDVTAWSWKDQYDGLFQSYQALEGELSRSNEQLDQVLDVQDKTKRERDEYKALYMNAFAAVRALAKLVVPEEPKG